MKIKICATCRHLKVVDQGREFEFIIDTEYTLFTCDVLHWSTREFYLMAPVDHEIKDSSDFQCKYWEEWTADS